MENLIITPETKIHHLLKHYPELEDVLIEIAPVFSKLKNPVLRSTIAKVTSLKQAAAVGGVTLEIMINRLRQEVGQDSLNINGNTETQMDAPDWFDFSNVVESLDARPIINSGGHPLDTVIKSVKAMTNGNIYELITPFLPVPLIDKVEERGFKSWTAQPDGDVFKTYFKKID